MALGRGGLIPVAFLAKDRFRSSFWTFDVSASPLKAIKQELTRGGRVLMSDTFGKVRKKRRIVEMTGVRGWALPAILVVIKTQVIRVTAQSHTSLSTSAVGLLFSASGGKDPTSLCADGSLNQRDRFLPPADLDRESAMG
jgi:hypothetical protein